MQEDGRWKYGTPPNGNANFAWMQHMLYHLSPRGVMATVLSNGLLSSNTSGEGEIRNNLVDYSYGNMIIKWHFVNKMLIIMILFSKTIMKSLAEMMNLLPTNLKQDDLLLADSWSVV